MKKIFLLFAVMGVISFSCEDMDFIQPQPQDRITAEVALSDLNGVSAVLNSAYNRLLNSNYYGQRMMVAPEALADNVVVNVNTGRYLNEQVNQVRAHLDIWNDPDNPNPTGYTIRGNYNAYRTINDCNTVLYALDQEGVSEPNQALADSYRGQALFIRALSYFDLLRVYSYEPGKEQNSWNAGVVMRTEAVLGASQATLLARSTNVEGYQQVETDLLAAINLLGAEAATPHRASNVAARALLARVYLYWGRYADAAAAAEQVLTSTTRTLASAANYASIWTATINPEAIFELRLDLVDWNTVDGVNTSLASITRTPLATATPAPLPNAISAVKASDELLAAFEAGDIRRTLWVARSGPTIFESLKWNGEQGDYRENIPLIRYSEVLLIAAEARARSGNDAAAQGHINTLRAARGLAATAEIGAGLTNLIMNERRVELCLEGHRFFDLKRLGLSISKTAAVSGGTPIQASDFRILAPLDNDYLSINNLAVDNPGYSN
jgi:hypothetical protein